MFDDLVADRFVRMADTWFDLASNRVVHFRWFDTTGTVEDLRWNDWCAEFARLRHPIVNPLVDYGLIGRRLAFEAYAMGEPLPLSAAAASLTLTHGLRFIEARGLPLTSEVAEMALRDIAVVGPAVRGQTERARSPSSRPLGVVLQRRAILETIRDALEEALPGGPVAITVTGEPGAGMSTLRTLVARAARLAGYVPMAGGTLLSQAWITARLWNRHVCLLLDDPAPPHERRETASFVACLSTASTRRHVVVRFRRSGVRTAGTVQIDPIGVFAMTAMLYIDRDCGPVKEEIVIAARKADGNPGRFLERLGAAPPGTAHVARTATVHESPPAYAVGRPADGPIRTHIVGRTLRDAPERAARLAARGRHASAVRVLSRALRVLEGRGEADLAAVCAERLAWIARDRGHSDEAAAYFERARQLVSTGEHSVRAALGLGIIWTDERRFVEAEAALRGACAAADLLGDPALKRRASLGLARCLFWQDRHDEAAALLQPLATDSLFDECAAETCARLARVRLALGDLRAAVTAATDALHAADRMNDGRALAMTARTMGIVQGALGDRAQVRHWVARAFEAAGRAHLPLVRLRVRGLLLTTLRAAGQTATASEVARLTARLRPALHHGLPALIRTELEAACQLGGPSSAEAAPASVDDRGLADLRLLLELAHGAPDDTAALDSICQRLGERLRASGVQIVSGPGEWRTLARTGRPWRTEEPLLTRVLAGARPPFECREPRLAAEPISYGQEPIAVLCCRWPTGVALDAERAAALLRAGALAAAAPVKSLLDRPLATPGPPVCADLIGTCPPTVALLEAVARAARAPFPVLVEGESGSGKELVARAIHRLSARRDRRLCTVNCAALTEDLLEAELFGHARGAFTGAVGERAGLFEEADGGTLFLDEVGELSPRAQAKLLRVLQDGEVRRVGENLARRVDARIVAATNRRLADEVAAGRFRADLRFRLDVVRITVPPLRERASDIPALATHFWRESTARVGSSSSLSAETLAALARYDWPGNVRELQNAIASLAVHAPRRGRVLPAMLPPHIARAVPTMATTFEAARDEFDRRFVRAALAQAGGHRARAARALGVSRQGLAKMLRRLHIE